MRRDEHGAGAVSGLLWIGILLALGMACVLAVGVITTHRRAQAAVDLAALAGAQAHQRGEDPCGAAAGVAARNGARLGDCHLSGADILVIVSVDAPAILGDRFTMRARARAGPAGVGGLAPGWE